MVKPMYDTLMDIGYDRKIVEEINNISYLKSRRSAVSKFLYIKELV